MTKYLRCTYGEGMLSNEKLITFRATRKPIMPFGAGEEGAYTFSWFLQVPELVYLDGRNALMPIEPNILNAREAAFLVCADQEVRWCFVPLEDIVERK
ncbi:MAG TPA: hypothetical protein HA362_03720 [Nanoarchaeota archaeon]|nr:hypothetical protein [Nanoarchaeota archaeon]